MTQFLSRRVIQIFLRDLSRIVVDLFVYTLDSLFLFSLFVYNFYFFVDLHNLICHIVIVVEKVLKLIESHLKYV